MAKVSPRSGHGAPSVSYPQGPEHYKLVDLCGRGASSQVWNADCHGARVAIKMVNIDQDCCRLLEKASTEAHILRSMAHPHILPMYTCFLAGPPVRPPTSSDSPLAAAKEDLSDTAHAAGSHCTAEQHRPLDRQLYDTAHEAPEQLDPASQQLPASESSQPSAPQAQGTAPSSAEPAGGHAAEPAEDSAPRSQAGAGDVEDAGPSTRAGAVDFDALAGHRAKHWLWMVLPCMEASLLDVLHNSHPQGIPLKALIAVARQVLLGLAALHEQGIIHRDIKASNILIHKQGFVQLADLGVASMQHRLVSHRSLQGGRPSLEALQALVAQQDGGQPACPLENAAKAAGVAQQGGEVHRANGKHKGVGVKPSEADEAKPPVRPKMGAWAHSFSYVGSPAWMAPEIMEQAQDGHGQAADVYSYGITLLELATGRAPYSGLPFAVQAMHKLHNPPPTLASLSPEASFPPELEDLVAHCLRRQPDERPSAAALLHHRLFKQLSKHAQQHIAVLVAPKTASEPIKQLPRSRSEAECDYQHRIQHEDLYPLHQLRAKDGQCATEHLTPERCSALLAKFAQPGLASARKSSIFKRIDAYAHPSPEGEAAEPPAGSPLLTTPALRAATTISFLVGGFGGFWRQHAWGSAITFSRLEAEENQSVWCGPAYLFMTPANTGIGMGDVRRERCVLLNSAATQLVVDRNMVHQLDFTAHQFSMDSADGAKVAEVMQRVSKLPEPHKVILSECKGGHVTLASSHFILHADDDANRALYGREVSLGEVLGGAVRPPPEWRPFVYELRGLDLAMDPNRQMSIPRTSTHAHSPSFPGGLTPPSEGSRTTRRTESAREDSAASPDSPVPLLKQLGSGLHGLLRRGSDTGSRALG